ncbi:hypothetical protein Adt_36269 [Abeliophyllum distichum]|uniref:Uncharacterized protein n=1 Tax=Abeliophyllum distichum TaxID=126358 RepID=A0ABD1QH23_9LAMI
MFTKSNNLVYEHGDVDYIGYVYSSSLNNELLDKLVEDVGLDLPMGFLYKKHKFLFLEGLVGIRSNIDIAMLLKDINGDNSNLRKGLVIIDPETRKELPRLDPSKLQTKAKIEKRKSKQEEDDMSSRSKRHRSKTSVKLVEIVELSGSESDVPNDNVESDVHDNTVGIKGDIVEGVGKEELESEIRPGGDNAGNGNDGDKSGNDVVDNVGG